MDKKQTVLITGVAGMLGSNFADYLLQRHGDEVTVVGIDNLEGGYIENINSKVIFHKCDCAGDLAFLFLKYNPTVVYHFACYAAEGLSPFIRTFNYNNNLSATANVVNYCVNYKCKLVFTSSMSVYGYGVPPFRETDQCQPIDPYGIAKYACEMDISAAHAQFGLDYAIIRPHNIIGTKQNIWDKYRNVIGIWVRQILNNEPITIYGDGRQTRAFSWVGDYFDPFYKLGFGSNHPNKIYNAGGDQYNTLNEVADMLFEVSGQNTGKLYLQPRFEVKDAYCDHTRIKTDLNLNAKTPLNYMLAQIWQWAQTQPKRDVKQWVNYEIERGIYDYWKIKR